MPLDGARAAALLAGGLSERQAEQAASVLRGEGRPSVGVSDTSTQALRGPLVGLTGLFVAQLIHDLLGTTAWVVLGGGALSGHVDRGWLGAWALLLVTMVPLRLYTSSRGGSVAIAVGTWLRRRLLRGALGLDPEVVRREGIGRLLGRVIEAERLETLGVDGAIQGLLAGGEGLMGAAVLLVTAPTLAGMLVVWLVGSAVVGAAAHRARQRTTAARLEVTDTLTERMLGHRTRLVQEPRGTWHDGEDGPTAAIAAAMTREDRWWGLLEAGCARGWLILGGSFVGCAAVGGASAGSLMASLGGVLLVQRALVRACGAAGVLSAAVIAWRHVRGLLGELGVPSAPVAVPGHPIALDLRGLRFGYPGRPTPVLDGLDLRVNPGDRVLVEGPSGGGKSTLGLLLAGLLRPTGGLLLAGGLDLGALGRDGWRSRVVAAPQFHQNHVYGGSLAFNLLMGRAWPPREADLHEATTLCEALGLGPLLERMPGGLFQVVGETGWQLSHGERSRVFLARALLQGAPIVVLDESFGALDPATLRRSVATARRWARTLVVIAHP